MIIMDSFFSYRIVAFLKSKSIEITLKVFKGFHTEAEQQTGKRLKYVRLDMRKETYYVEQGLDFEFTTLYAYQQNRVAEQSM